MRRLALTVLAAACLAGPAHAVDDNQKVPTRAPDFTSVPQDSVLTNNLIGLTVVNGQQDSVGEIKDLAIDSGKLRAYILSVGGFLGMGDHYVAVAPDSISLGYDAEGKKWKAIIGATKEQLKSAPEFKYEGKFKR